MCLIAVAFKAAPHYELVIAANRDELHARPSEGAGWWRDYPELLGGRDLVAGGTWLAVHRAGRFAAVTNVREGSHGPFPRSRGLLVTDYLRNGGSAREFVAALEPHADSYGPFNLLVYDGSDLRFASNRGEAARLEPGTYALSNGPLGADWPKIERARAGLAQALQSADPIEPLFALLAEREAPSPGPSTLPLHARLFVEGEHYGTRSSTVVLLNATGELTFVERRFDARAALVGETRERFIVGRQEPEHSRAAAGSEATR